VLEVLENLGLDQRKDLKVGNPLEKTISGGQRKRLNIALELIREPAVLFLDEPTSGLSSRDSENVIDLLKELSLKGKLIYVVIHQPSSDIYKMFDKMIIMDTGGYQSYYGTPVEAVSYFKKATHQVDSNRGQCETCGNVNPEQIFNIIEAKVVDEYGQPTNKRKITPPQWFEMYSERFKPNRVEDVKEEPPNNLRIPNRFKQTVIFTTRDFLSKLSNKQYLLINLLEAPLLAFILTFIIKYKSAPGGKEYIFRFNDNFPAFLLMSIIVALFMGLTVSAEEIIRDRKILKRESFLNLSWNSYLFSKLAILFLLSAIQTLSFVLVGNFILEIHGMTFAFWLILFSTSCFANVLGLNISSAFNSAVTVYVMIPLLLIPQMILSGVLFNFDKLNNLISTKGKVPLIADVMASRWAYEAMAVYQFTNNSFEALYYEYEKQAAIADFKASHLADKLKTVNKFVIDNFEAKETKLISEVENDLKILRNSLRNEKFKKGIENINSESQLVAGKYTKEIGDQLDTYFEDYRANYQKVYKLNESKIDKRMTKFEKKGRNINDEKNLYMNESLSDLVRNVSVKDRLLEYNGELIQQINPIFQNPGSEGIFDYRTQFFAPKKNLLGVQVSTLLFNVLVVWCMTAIFYGFLYFELLKKGIDSFGKVNLPKKK
jgi:energy-coupling factor transporter ATP-binding protein EcfA2